MDDLEERIAAGELLLQQAMDALRRYNEAKGHASPEVERLGIRAVSLMAEDQEYQLRTFGGPMHPHARVRHG